MVSMNFCAHNNSFILRHSSFLVLISHPMFDYLIPQLLFHIYFPFIFFSFLYFLIYGGFQSFHNKIDSGRLFLHFFEFTFDFNNNPNIGFWPMLVISFKPIIHDD